MSDENELAPTEAEEMASVMAGYNKARGDEPPAEVKPEPSAVQEETPVVEPVIEPVADLASELKDLKAKVAASHGDPDAIRRMHGEIGNINRTLKALQSTANPVTAPADDEFAAALNDAEKAAVEFPEVVGPIVKALKASLSRQVPVPVQDIEARVSTAIKETRENDAIESLKEEHPDYETVRETPEYKTWLTSKPPEFQHRFNTTWNPAVVARGLSEFKDSLKKREQKQNRLATAVAPQGVPQKASSSTLSDEDALLVGYNSGPKRRIFKR